MNTHRTPPDLQRLAAEQIEACLEDVSIGAPLPLDSSSDLCDTLELLVPELLRRTHTEWEDESIDGYSFSSAVKTDKGSAQLAGTCILISDQTVTPFLLNAGLSNRHEFGSFRIRLGEPGGGALGISGPPCNSRAAQELLLSLDARLGRVGWVYDVSL